MIVTIDGPAGAGKSTVAKALAKRLGFRFLDTGAMYRVVALAATRRRLDWRNADALADLAQELTIELDAGRVLLDGEDVTGDIRAAAITDVIHHVADNPRIRARLVELQRQFAGRGNYVTEGRDQGSLVFPAAECKIFLTASAEERARRRVRDLAAQGEQRSVEDILRQQNERDHRDRTRPVGPLTAAPDAVQVDTDGLNLEEVVDVLEEMVRRKLPND